MPAENEAASASLVRAAAAAAAAAAAELGVAVQRARPQRMKRWQRGLGIVALLTGVLLASAQPARADFLELWAAPAVGVAYGGGAEGVDFFDWAEGGAAGFEVGLRVLFLSAYFEYLRFFGGDVGANLLSINLGGDSEFRLSQSLGIVVRLAGSYYFGSLDSGSRSTGGRVFNSDWVETQGIGFRGGLGPRFHFAQIFSVGITPQIGYHSFFAGADRSGSGLSDTNSSGWDLQALLYLRAGLGF